MMMDGSGIATIGSGGCNVLCRRARVSLVYQEPIVAAFQPSYVEKLLELPVVNCAGTVRAETNQSLVRARCVQRQLKKMTCFGGERVLSIPRGTSPGILRKRPQRESEC